MITVRFLTGVSVQYNVATRVEYIGSGAARLYESRDASGVNRGWVADVPSSCVIEAQLPCRVYNAVNDPNDLLDAAFELIATRPERGYRLARIKAELERFDARSRRWK